jgi:hypothetical protein
MVDEGHVEDCLDDAEEERAANHFVYHIKSDEHFIVRDDGKKEHLPVKRIKGHFDKDQHYVIESVSEPR